MDINEKDIKLIANSGVKWVRIDILWSKVETKKGKYDFTKTGYDKLNNLLKKFNIILITY
ncbi:hypothetical protein COE55_09685 [Priestia megaterium]|uniref:beta-galactosidase n=1 Tax=Priestia megaterium TaxID=1404 RepID=UPI000BFDE8FC|nr:beta-galactosidase [Priestia megaterium]PGZ80212.1 hypothetical protein COE55_09685 [Priestia megaterium]